MKLPIKTRILEYAIEKDGPFTCKEMSKDLSKEYNGEKTTTFKNIEKQLENYCRVGFIKGADPSVDSEGELQVMYHVTKAGKESLKYIPGHGNKYF